MKIREIEIRELKKMSLFVPQDYFLEFKNNLHQEVKLKLEGVFKGEELHKRTQLLRDICYSEKFLAEFLEKTIFEALEEWR